MRLRRTGSLSAAGAADAVLAHPPRPAARLAVLRYPLSSGEEFGGNYGHGAVDGPAHCLNLAKVSNLRQGKNLQVVLRSVKALLRKTRRVFIDRDHEKTKHYCHPGGHPSLPLRVNAEAEESHLGCHLIG